MCSMSLTPSRVPQVLNLGFFLLLLVQEIPKCIFSLISQYMF